MKKNSSKLIEEDIDLSRYFKSKKADQNILSKLLSAVVHRMYIDNSLDIKDLELSRRDFLNKVIAKLGRLENVTFTTDYTPNILEQAKHFLKIKNYSFAILFYATYFEHSINSLILTACLRRRLDQKIRTAIIRSVDLNGKFTWLSAILELPKFNAKHLTTIKKVADERNGFVHYKWRPEDDMDVRIEGIDLGNDLEQINNAVRYMKAYSTKFNFANNKIRINEKLKRN